MAITQLITQADIESRMALGAVPAASDVIASAINAAHLRVESELETTLTKGSYVDTFFLDKSQFGVVPNHFYKLRLKNGFVRNPAVFTGGPAISIVSAPDPTLFGTGDPTVQAVANCQYDYDRGIVAVPEQYMFTQTWPWPPGSPWPFPNFDKSYVQVSYDAGFLAADVVAGLVADRLKEALIAYTVALIDVSGTTGASEKGASVNGKAALAHAVSVITRYRRKVPFFLDPVY